MKQPFYSIRSSRERSSQIAYDSGKEGLQVEVESKLVSQRNVQHVEIEDCLASLRGLLTRSTQRLPFQPQRVQHQ